MNEGCTVLASELSLTRVKVRRSGCRDADRGFRSGHHIVYDLECMCDGQSSMTDHETIMGGSGDTERLPNYIATLGSKILLTNPDIHGTVMDGESVLLNLRTGRYYSLNRVGTVVWQQCSSETTFEDLLGVICEGFDVAVDVARKDLAVLIEELSDEGLLVQNERR